MQECIYIRQISPLLIDFGRSDVYPRLFDFAALDVDLILSLMDHRSGLDQDFSRIGGWLDHVTQQYLSVPLRA